MSEEIKKTFDELVKIAKSKGLSDRKAIYAAHELQTLSFYDRLINKYADDEQTEDIEYEEIEPKKLPENKK